MNTRRPRVLVGCTGSVASVKMPLLLESLSRLECLPEVKLVTTKHSRHFFDVGSVSCPLFTDESEWEAWNELKDPVLHIELRRWADLFVIAPLDANTLAKLCHGVCDNLLTCVVRAWDLQRPLLFAPAMNTHMWDHPFTSQQVATLKGLGYQEIPCISKKLACGDSGMGAMAEVSSIVTAVARALESQTLKDSLASDTDGHIQVPDDAS